LINVFQRGANAEAAALPAERRHHESLAMKKSVLAAIAAAACATFLVRAVVHAHDMAGMETASSGSPDAGAMGAMGKRMVMSAHMTMTEPRPPTPADVERARQILETMRAALSKYKDYKAAMADGYEPFMPTVPQDVYHFANRQVTVGEYLGDFDLKHPGSLLYEKSTFGGWKLVGAMYDAPPKDTPAQLDRLIPLGIARWHQHTNICLPAGVTEQDVMNGKIGARMRPDISSAIDGPMQRSSMARMRFGYMADPRFGFTGTISTQAECEAVGGNFHPRIFGWMVHVYPFEGDDLKVAFSTEAP
jgi:hypothetical protein